MLSFTKMNDTEYSNYGTGDERHKRLKPTILIADDDDDNRAMLKVLLEIWDYNVLEAKDGREALGFAEKTCPDLILMDVRMPRFDGFETARRLRRSEKTRRVPIIFLSGCAENKYRKEAGAVGGNEYFIKPLDFGELERTIFKYLSE